MSDKITFDAFLSNYSYLKKNPNEPHSLPTGKNSLSITPKFAIKMRPDPFSPESFLMSENALKTSIKVFDTEAEAAYHIAVKLPLGMYRIEPFLLKGSMGDFLPLKEKFI